MSARSGNTAWVRACLACVAVVALVGLAADAAGATSLRAKKGQALAKRAVLRRSDFPPGWRSQDSTESRKQGDRVRAEIRDCRRYRAEAVRFRSHAHAASPDFLQPTAGLRVSNQAAVFPSANAASADLRIVSDPKTAPCLEKAADVAVRARLRQQGVQQATVDVSATPLSPAPVGDEVAGLRIDMKIAASQLSAEQVAELRLIRVGRTVVALSLQGAPNLLLQAPTDDLIAKIVGRITPG